MSRSTVMFLLKALVSLALLSFLLSRIDRAEFFFVMSSARLSYLFIALAGYVLAQILCSVRWLLLARPLGFKSPFKDYVVYYFIGMFFNLFTPSTIGGDVGRVYYLARGESEGRGNDWNGSTGPAFVSVVADRFIGFAVLAWIGAVALIVFPAYVFPAIIRYLTFALAAGFLLSWLFLPMATRFLHRKGFVKEEKLLLGLQSYAEDRRVVVGSLVLSLVAHLIQTWIQVVLGRALGVEIPWSYSVVIYPLIGTFSALPVSLNGIGLREGGYLYLLRQIGISSERGIAFGILWFIIVALDSLIGGVVFILRRNANPSVVASDIKNPVR